MNLTRLCLASTLVIAGLAALPFTRPTKKPGVTIETAGETVLQRVHTTAQPWNGWMVIHGDQYVPIVDELGRNFESARESFLQMDFETAAQETRKASELLSVELKRASGKEKVRLEASIRDLNLLAAELDRQRVEELSQIDAVFGEAHQADMERNWISVGVRSWSPMAQAPSVYFHLATEDLVRRNFDAAATSIRKAAGLLKLEATRAGLEGNTRLVGSSQALSKLAVEIEKGSSPDGNVLRSTFAAAQYALADSHWRKAARDWNLKEPKDTGHELEAAVFSLAEGTEWAGPGAEFDSSLVLEDALSLSKRLIEGAPESLGEVVQQLRTVGQEIQSLDQSIATQNDGTREASLAHP